MDSIEQSAFAGQAVGRAMSVGFRGPARRALALLLAVRLGLALVLVLFAHPWLSPIGAPLMARAAGERALHFPAGIHALPLAHARWSSMLDVLLLPLVAAVTCMLVARRLPSEEAHVVTGRRLLPGTLALVPVAFVLGYAERAMAGAVAALAGGSASAVISLAGAFVVLSALIAITLPLLALASLGHPRTESVWDAWRWSWGRAGVAYVVLGAGTAAASLALLVGYARTEPVLGAIAPEWSAAAFAIEMTCRTLLQWAVAGAAAVLWIGLVEDPWG